MRRAILALALCLVSSCLAPRAKPLALFPPAALTWPAVENDYQRGISDGVADAELSERAAATLRDHGASMGQALADRSVEELREVPWAATMKPWAARGIADKLEDGEIGPGVAVSLSEQLANFTTTIARLQEP